MNVERELEKIILQYYTRPQKYTDFEKLIYSLHERLIDSQQLSIKEDGVLKTRILGNG